MGNESKYEDYKDNPDYDTPFFDLYKDELSSEEKLLPEYNESDVEQYNPYVNYEVLLDHNATQLCRLVKGHKQERDRTLYGKANTNHILDTRVYDLSFPDRTNK